jgi:hypothetical protein
LTVLVNWAADQSPSASLQRCQTARISASQFTTAPATANGARLSFPDF